MRTLPLLFTLFACTPDAPLAPAEDPGAGQLIYGADDRLEIYEVNSALASVADATVAVMRSTDVSIQGSTAVLNTSTSFGAAYDLCSSEPFAGQPSTASCSGFLAGPDLIVTAGHCIDSSSCSSTRFVFGFEMIDANTVVGGVPAGEVYSCSNIVARQETNGADYAVVRLDRPVSGHTPLTMASGAPTSGTPLVVMGHPAGIPLKIAGGASVRGIASTYFEANLDTYGGNSGSAVFNASTLEVEGILVRGNTDFVRTGRGRNACNVSNTCSDSGCPGFEDATRIDQVTPFLDGGGEPPPPPPECTDDSLEPNDSQGSATPVSPGTLVDLSICSGNDDWFELLVSEGDDVSALLSFSHAAGDLDLELRDAQGVLDTSAGTSDSEAVAGTARATGSAWVRVLGYAGAENSSYDLDLDVTSAPPPPPGGTCGDGVCGTGESCDGRSGTSACGDCDGRVNGKPDRRFCLVEGVCEGPGCP